MPTTRLRGFWFILKGQFTKLLNSQIFQNICCRITIKASNMVMIMDHGSWILFHFELVTGPFSTFQNILPSQNTWTEHWTLTIQIKLLMDTVLCKKAKFNGAPSSWRSGFSIDWSFVGVSKHFSVTNTPQVHCSSSYTRQNIYLHLYIISYIVMNQIEFIPLTEF